MRHYEIVLLIHPGQSEQVSAMVGRYCTMVESSGGKIHRQEDWGRRMLAYPIKELHKAHYILLNIEIGAEPLKELSNAFRFNDAIIRDLIIKRDCAITDPSVFAKTKEADAVDASAKNDTQTEGTENNNDTQAEVTENNNDTQAEFTEDNIATVVADTDITDEKLDK